MDENYENNSNYDANSNNGNNTEGPKKKKKSNGAAKKFFGAVGLAIVFGFVASIVFTGTNAILDKFVKRPEQKIEKSAEEPKAIEKNGDMARPEESGKEKSAEKNLEKGLEKKSEKNLERNPIEEIGDKLLDVRPNRENGLLEVTDVVEETMPSIVAITNESIQKVRSFYGSGISEYKSESAGSGIIIGQNDTELLIVTNAHVVDNAETLTVCFIDNEAYEAKVKGSDSKNDIAVIAVSLSDVSGSTLDEIKIAKVGSSNNLKIGEQVVAIGNAMGYGQSVTTGIVSALNRTIDGSQEGQSYIQTDAAINPGNSGGALLNMDGELVGINSAKLANTKIEGMGYAIPIDAANEIVEGLMNLITREKVDAKDAGYLGISGFSVTDEVAMAYSIPKGIYVSEATEGGAAKKAGIQKGDVIVSFDGMSMDSINKLRERLDYYKAGEKVEVVVARADEGEYKEKTLVVTLDGREGSPLDEGFTNEEDSDTQEGADNSSESDGDIDDGQKSGEFNIGGSTFKYSVPDNIFDIFGW